MAFSARYAAQACFEPGQVTNHEGGGDARLGRMRLQGSTLCAHTSVHKLIHTRPEHAAVRLCSLKGQQW